MAHVIDDVMILASAQRTCVSASEVYPRIVMYSNGIILHRCDCSIRVTTVSYN